MESPKWTSQRRQQDAFRLHQLNLESVHPSWALQTEFNEHSLCPPSLARKKKPEPSQLLRTDLGSPKLWEPKQVSLLDRPETDQNTGRFWWRVQQKKNPRMGQKLCSHVVQEPGAKMRTERRSAALRCVSYLPPLPPDPPLPRKDRRRFWRKEPDESQLLSALSCCKEENSVHPCSLIDLFHYKLHQFYFIISFLSGN